MTCPAVVRLTVPASPAVVRVATPGPPGPAGTGGSGGSDLVRIAVAGNTIYTGHAPVGTAESSPGWMIKRRIFSATGTLTSTATASGAWTNRASLTYT